MRYDVVNACGCTYEYRLVGNSKGRRQKIEWLETQDCPDCRKAEREKEAKQRVKEAETDCEMPKLQGSDKQIEWAARIRAGIYLSIQSLSPEWCQRVPGLMAAIDGADLEKSSDALKLHAIDKLFSRKSARFWIDHRAFEASKLLAAQLPTDIVARLQKTGDPMRALTDYEEEKADNAAAAAAAMTLVKSEDADDDLIAVITISGNTVCVAYPQKCEVFADVVKLAGFRWSGSRWQRIRREWETIDNVAAHIGRRLLAKGFHIQALDDIAQKAVSGEFEAINNRYVTARDKTFILNWPYGKQFSREASQLPGARWISPEYTVPAAAFREVQDFAEINRFLLTPSALALIAERTAMLDAAASVKIEEKEKEKVGARPDLVPLVDAQPLASLVDAE